MFWIPIEIQNLTLLWVTKCALVSEPSYAKPRCKRPPSSVTMALMALTSRCSSLCYRQALRYAAAPRWVASMERPLHRRAGAPTLLCDLPMRAAPLACSLPSLAW